MKTGLYSLAELFSSRQIEQLVIPEIQRDYVWGKPQVLHLFGSILENYRAWRDELGNPTLHVVSTKAGTGDSSVNDTHQSLQAEFSAFHARRIHSTNVGFVYAYGDADLPGQCFLIDGQQRLTTLYIALLAVATQSEGLKERFRARYCLSPEDPSEEMAVVPTRLDYRLREQTAQFLHQWVHFLLQEGQLASEVKDQAWYLLKLNNDTTIRNLLANYQTVQDQLDTTIDETSAEQLFAYLEDLVQCWYFDTNESAQGEELYLYLNARGEGIATNEDKKARLLGTLGNAQEKEKWGRLWEEWQDYFWLNRDTGLKKEGDNPNADRGFNSFLICIENLEKLHRREQSNPSNELSLDSIGKYVAALRWLEENKENFQHAYHYADWLDDWFTTIWSCLNQATETEWGANLNDRNKSTAHNRMVLLWGTLLCVLHAQDDSNLESLDFRKIFRAIRVFYLRYHNNSRAVSSLPLAVNGLLSERASVFIDLPTTSSEERERWTLLYEKPERERQRFEEVIWKIEDHPINLNGSDLGAVNIIHLLDLHNGITLRELEVVREAFYELFGKDESSSASKKRLASVLLYYGDYWHRESPYYYQNYDLENWRRTIRGRGSNEKSPDTKTVFRRFFDEFLQTGQNLEEFALAKKGTVQIAPENEDDLRKALIWYSEHLGPHFLGKGMHVALGDIVYGQDKNFAKLSTLWNTQGNFKGYHGNIEMSKQ